METVNSDYWINITDVNCQYIKSCIHVFA